MKVILKLQTNTIVSEIPLEVGRQITIGRSSSCDHKVPDELMSSTHCRINLQTQKMEITDLESKNGTYLNGLRIEKSEIFLGDEIKIGGTKITIVSDKMDPQSVDALTFPGAVRDRQSHGLQLDFTGARMINQGLVNPATVERKPTSSANQELEARKKAKSTIKLSKHEIKLRNKKRASLASTFDVILMIFSIAAPLLASNVLILMSPTLIQEHRLMFMLGSVLLCVVLFFILNFKVLKFTIGEKISGIEDLYKKQN